MALLLAAFLFQGGTALTVEQQSATPTPDRLAEPTLPASPSQADAGAQVYWLSCMPCHGDRGQGLTDEFRNAYPPEDRNCWESGCHGKRPYQNGFTLPMTIPAVIGPGTISNFSDAAQLQAFIHAAMPFWKPGSLTDEDSWRVTAFILRQNGLWNDTVELDASNATSVKIPGGTPNPVVTPQQAQVQNGGVLNPWLILIGILLMLVVLFFVLKKSKNKTTI